MLFSLKLCNFYLDVNNNVKLGDFGFACQLASEYDKKRETCGTPNYIAPEAIEDIQNWSVDQRNQKA